MFVSQLMKKTKIQLKTVNNLKNDCKKFINFQIDLL